MYMLPCLKEAPEMQFHDVAMFIEYAPV